METFRSSQKAPECHAIGCTRRTRDPGGYCFQHTGMLVATLDRIERLIQLGAEVRLGKRRMHVIHKDEDGMAKIECDIAAWDAYKASGRPMPKHMRSGLR